MAGPIHEARAFSLSATCQHSISVGSVPLLVERVGNCLTESIERSLIGRLACLGGRADSSITKVKPPCQLYVPSELTLVKCRIFH
jgi:hypothetical protein